MKGPTMNCIFCKRTKEEPLDSDVIYGICGKHWNNLIAKIDAMITATQKYKVKTRLPYEAEWEYACRAGSTTKY